MDRAPGDVVRAWFQRVWNEGDEDAIGQMFPEHGIAHGIGQGAEIRGPGAFRAFHEQMNRVCDDVHVDVLETIDCGDRTYARCEARLTRGDEVITIQGGTLVRVEGDQLVEAFDAWNFLGAMEARGALPEGSFGMVCMGARFVPASSD